MKLAPGAPGARILGVGDYRPVRVMPNSELETMVDTSDQWIRERTGIVSRRIAAPDETVVDMGAAAGAKALAAAGLTPADVDLVLVATCSHADRMPGAAPLIASRLGIPSPGALDVNAACAGFPYAVAQASDAIRSGNARRVLVIGAEKMSALVDWTDRGTCILFADGAGAVVVGPSDEPGIGPVVWGSDGGRGDLITCLGTDPFLRMEGPAVFRWATTSLAPVVREACARAGVEVADLKVIVFHQANARIIDAVVRALRLGDDVVVARDVIESGNTSAASIPMALARVLESGEVESGSLALLLGFGSGLNYAGQVVALP
ncbi:MAG: 3-oxoacyl-[acyl-carrier-protein] synthase [Frankiales bacterium]|nr:3-oxoacyl-[acyl-carrier-protein] synthase [Frankiales bacterium]